jgi:hypothetical protein
VKPFNALTLKLNSILSPYDKNASGLEGLSYRRRRQGEIPHSAGSVRNEKRRRSGFRRLSFSRFAWSDGVELGLQSRNRSHLGVNLFLLEVELGLAL